MSDAARLKPEHIRAVRLGHGANCSSVGSVIDTLFLSAAVGSAIFVAVCAAIEADADTRETEPEHPSEATDGDAEPSPAIVDRE